MARVQDAVGHEVDLAASAEWRIAARPAPPAETATGRPRRSQPRRVWAVWALLFFNVIGSAGNPTFITIPHRVQQALTQGALAGAFVLALTLNPKVRLRPNLFLYLYSLLAVTSLMTSIRFISFGTDYRILRLIVMLVTLWLLTPWWGRRDLVVLRCQVRILVLVLASVVLGLLLSPGAADTGGRLGGALWPIPPTQVAHYMAELTGLAFLLWLCGIMTRRQALLAGVPALVVLVETHTRTALIGLGVGLLVAGLSLFAGSRRVRKMFAGAAILVVLVVLPLSPLIMSWLARGENSQQLSTLTGRTRSWDAVFSEQRPLLNVVLGSGLSNKSVVGATGSYTGLNGLPIDSGWVSTYQDQGWAGDILEGAMFLALVLLALLRPRGPTRAMAFFIIVYCFIASFTESGMGDASTYLLDLTVAASLLAVPMASDAGAWVWGGKRRWLPQPLRAAAEVA